MDDRLISLNAAIDAVHGNYDKILDFRSNGETVANSVEDILSELPYAQPTIDAVPVVHGRWQYHINANNEVNPEDAYCSKCGFYVDVTTTFNFNKYLHCPYCGTRMDWKDGDWNG